MKSIEEAAKSAVQEHQVAAENTDKKKAWRALRTEFPERETEMRDIAQRLGIVGVTVERHGQVVAAWGDTDGHGG